MKLVPSGTPCAALDIGPTEANRDFTVDFENEMPAETHIVDYGVTATRLGSGEDITEGFVSLVAQSGTKVKATVGDGAQVLHAVYRLTYTVTLDNEPPSTIVGYVDITCKS